MVGAQVPRIRVVPDGTDHPLWGEVADFTRRLDVGLDEWQLDVLRSSLRRAGDVWAAFTVAVCCPRQNGKNSILEIRELVGAYLLGEPLVIHSAHLADTSKEAFRRLELLLDMNDWLAKDVKHVWRTNGHESIEFRNGNRIRFRTRTKGGGRGFAKGSPVIFDESMIFPEVSIASILPIASAHPDPQLWYTGSAVDQQIMEDGVVFARVRDRALRGDHERLAYFEWSLEYDTPDDIPDDVDVLEATAETNPAFGRRITADYVLAERRELSDRAFAVERWGVGDWPDPEGSSALISREAWDACEDSESVMVDPVWFAVDVSPNRSTASICAAGRRPDGRFHIEVVENRSGTGWIVGRCAELRASHKPAGFVVDQVGPAASLLEPLLDVGVEAETVATTEHARSCGLMFDAVQQRTVAHLGSRELALAVRGAATRPLGDAWAWSRKNSEVDITSLVGCTLALGAVARATSRLEPMVAFG